MTPGRAALRVRLVVLNHDAGPALVDCVTSLRAQHWDGPAPDVVVVDNASRDGSFELLRKAHPGVRIIANPRNDGFPANNLALGDLGDVDVVGLLNPDAVAEPDWLATSVEALQSEPDIGAVAPTILLSPAFVELGVHVVPTGSTVELLGVRGVDRTDLVHLAPAGAEPGGLGLPLTLRDGSVLRLPASPAPTGEAELTLRAPGGSAQVTVASVTTSVGAGAAPVRLRVGVPDTTITVVQNRGIDVDPTGNGRNVGFLGTSDDNPAQPVEVFGWCGGAVVFRSEYLDDVGLFEPRLFLYYEDLDLSWRARRRGWRHVHAPRAVVHHQHGASRHPELALRYGARNRLLVATRNGSASTVARAWFAGLGGCVRSLARPARAGGTAAARARAAGVAAAVPLVPWALRSRRSLGTTAAVRRPHGDRR